MPTLIITQDVSEPPPIVAQPTEIDRYISNHKRLFFRKVLWKALQLGFVKRKFHLKTENRKTFPFPPSQPGPARLCNSFVKYRQMHEAYVGTGGHHRRSIDGRERAHKRTNIIIIPFLGAGKRSASSSGNVFRYFFRI